MPSPPRIQVVAEGRPVRKTLERVFSDEGCDATVAEAALERGELPAERREQRSALSLSEAARQGLSLRELVDLYIEEVLERNGGRKSEAARALGICRKTIYRHFVGRSEDTGE